MLINVVNGRVVNIVPNPDNPNNTSNISTDFERKRKSEGSRICIKSNAGIMQLYDPDRVKQCLKRTNPEKGRDVDPKWVEIPYEQAVKEIAAKLKEQKEKYGPESLAWFSEDHSFIHIQEDFCLVHGTPNYMKHGSLCDSARRSGFTLLLGHERLLPDLANAKYMLLFGWNPLGATKWMYLPSILIDGLLNGAKLVTVTPCFDATAAKAHEWLPIKMGTDTALVAAMANVIVGENLHDRDFVRNWTIGFDKYSEYVKDKTPEWAEPITGIPSETIRRIAREFAVTKPAVADIWSGAYMNHNHAAQVVRAVGVLNAITGNIDKPGTFMIPDRRGGKHRSLILPRPKAEFIDGRGKKYPFATGQGVFTEARDAMITGQPYQVRSVMIVFNNFVMTCPNTQKSIEALKKMDMVVVVDTMMSETALMADYVIPGTTYFERYDLNTHWVTFPCVGLRQPVIPPLFGQKPEYQFVIDLAREMGYGENFNFSYEQYLSDELKRGIGITLEELKALPGAVWIGGKTRYEKYNEKIVVPSNATVDPQTGLVKDSGGSVIGVTVDGQTVRGFNTATRRIAIYDQRLVDKGFDGLPVYMEPWEKPSAEYPFYLTTWRDIHHTHTRTLNNPWLMEIYGENSLWINTETASKLGIKDGDLVWIESRISKDKIKAHATERIRPDTVGMYRGFGHWGFGKIARGKGCHDGQFFPGVSDPISGQGLSKGVAVKVYKA